MNNTEAPKVMLFGTFHFANPQQDLIKNEVHDVMSKSSQTYLDQLSKRIANFKPTAVLLEYDKNDDHNVNSRYIQYLQGNYELSRNEIEQLGFRIAKQNRLERVYSFDERNVVWKSQKVFEKFNQTPELEQQFNKMISKFVKDESLAHSTLSLQDLLKRYNSIELDEENKRMYILTNVIGVDEDFSGAEAATSWWHRNFRMYARIQKHAKPGARLLVIGGQGHTALLRDFLNMDPVLKTENINLYL